MYFKVYRTDLAQETIVSGWGKRPNDHAHLGGWAFLAKINSSRFWHYYDMFGLYYNLFSTQKSFRTINFSLKPSHNQIPTTPTTKRGNFSAKFEIFACSAMVACFGTTPAYFEPINRLELSILVSDQHITRYRPRPLPSVGIF